MKSFFKTFLACFAAIVTYSIFSVIMFFVMIAGFVSMFSTEDAYQVKSNSILRIDLAINMPDLPSTNPMDNFDFKNYRFKPTVSLFEAVSLLEAAADDPRIEGIYLNIPSQTPNSLSSLYELRQGIEKFRKKSGKFVVAFADVYSQGGYYLATSADKVYLNPQGGIDWSGMSSTVMFYKGVFDKLGIQPEIIRHGKFKGAVEPFMLDKMSPENRLQMQDLLGSMWGYMVQEIGLSRSIEPEKLQQYASEMAITSPAVALEKKMVDSLFYTDQMQVELAKLINDKEPRMISLAQYKSANSGTTRGNITSKNQIAVVYAQGDIVDSGDDKTSIVGNALAEEIRKVRKDDAVKAVVLRVNSPGGSVLASDVIWREVELTRKVKPVIVSMGQYAASGGYYISCPADAIITTPATITGSIGVFGMMFNVEKGAREKLGLTVDVVKTNPMADAGNIFRGLSTPERTMIQNSIDTIYTRFVTLVANGRELSYNTVDDMAQGRVWSGLQAVDNKLADKIGTLRDAIDMAAERAAVVDYRIKTYPQNDESMSAILQSLSEASVRYVKASMGLAPQVDLVKQTIERNEGIWAKIPYQIDFK